MMAASQDRTAPEPLIRRLALIAPAHPFMITARMRLAFSYSVRTNDNAILAAHSKSLRSQSIGRMYAGQLADHAGDACRI